MSFTLHPQSEMLLKCQKDLQEVESRLRITGSQRSILALTSGIFNSSVGTEPRSRKVKSASGLRILPLITLGRLVKSLPRNPSPARVALTLRRGSNAGEESGVRPSSFADGENA